VNIRGWVYVISNEAMPGLLKVGFSTKDPHLRARELSHTGSPRPYIVEYDALVRAPRETEQLIHKALRGQRDGKEWFRCTLDQAVAAIQSVALERLSEEYRVAPTAQKVNELKTSSPKPVSMPRARSNSSARWRWSERTQQLVEKGGSRSFGPHQYTYDGSGQIRGFAIRDAHTPWVSIEDVEITA
jgi:hypothetical protein